MRTLAESPHFILAHEHESAFAVDKRSGARHPVGEHYGDPCCGLISPDQDWFLVGGEGLTFLDLQRGPRKFLRPAGRGALVIHALRLEGRRRVRVLVDPWAEEHASTWELDLDRLSVSKLADGPRLVNQPYREDVPF